MRLGDQIEVAGVCWPQRHLDDSWNLMTFGGMKPELKGPIVGPQLRGLTTLRATPYHALTTPRR